MTLHEAILTVLKEAHNGVSPADLAKAINERSLYRRDDGQPVPASQISARVNNYPQLFQLSEGKVHLALDNYTLAQHEIQRLLNSHRDLPLTHIQTLIPFLFFFARFSNGSGATYFSETSFAKLTELRGEAQEQYLRRAVNDLQRNNMFRSLSPKFIDTIASVEHDHSRQLKPLVDHVHYVYNTIASRIFKDFFNELLQSLSGIHESYATSRELAEYISSAITIEQGASLCDPFAGTGTLIREVLKSREFDVSCTLVDLVEEVVFLGTMNLAVSGIEAFEYYCRDSIRLPVPGKGKFDWVITEPPIGVKFMPHELDYADFLKIPVGYRSENVMLQLVLSLLNETGKAAVALGEGFLFATDNNTVMLRSYLLENDLIEAIHSFPAGINPRTKAKFSVMFLNKNKKDDAKGTVLFKEVALGELKARDFEFLVQEDEAEYGSKSIIVRLEDIIKNNALLNANRYLASDDIPTDFVKLSELLKFKGGTNIKSDFKSSTHDLPYVKVKDLVNQGLNFNLDFRKVEESVDSDAVDITHQLQGPCVLVAKAGKDLKATYVGEPRRFVINPNIVALFPKDSPLNLEFITLQLHQPYMNEQLQRIRGGAVIPFVRIDDLMELRIRFPDTKEQDRLLATNRHLSNDTGTHDTKLLSAFKHEFSNLKEVLDAEQYLLKKFLDKLHGSEKPFSWNDKGSSLENARTVSQIFENSQMVLRDMGLLLEQIQEVLSVNVQTLKKESVNVYDLVNSEKAKMLSQIKDVQFLFLHQDLEPRLDIDASLFSIVIRNFLLNSVKHGFVGQSDLKFVAFDYVVSEDGLWAEFYMMNNGKDLPEDFELKDFVSFGGKSANSSGSGIGGYLMNVITEMHGGNLEIPKEFYDKGLFYLPASESHEFKDDFLFIPSVVFKISLPLA